MYAYNSPDHIKAQLKRKPREGYENRMWWERNARRSQPQTWHQERKKNPKPLQKYRHISKGKLERAWPTPNRTRATYAHKLPDPIYERKPVCKGSHERTIELVGGGNEMHVGGNPKPGTKRADTIPNHYENLIMSRRENSGGHSLPRNAHGQRTHTKARIPFKNMHACLERKQREGHQTRRW